MDRKANIEDLVAWQKSKELSVAAFRITEETGISRNEILKDKLVRSALNVPYGIATSYGMKRGQGSLDALYESRAGLFEFKTTMSIAVDLGLIPSERIDEIQPLTEHVDRLLSGLIQYKEESRNGFKKNRNHRGNNSGSASEEVNFNSLETDSSTSDISFNF